MKAVTETVSSLDGVDKVEVDFSNKLATIIMKDGKTLTKEALDKAFEGTRFKVTAFETVDADVKKKDEPEKDEGADKED